MTPGESYLSTPSKRRYDSVGNNESPVPGVNYEVIWGYHSTLSLHNKDAPTTGRIPRLRGILGVVWIGFSVFGIPGSRHSTGSSGLAFRICERRFLIAERRRPQLEDKRGGRGREWGR